MGSVGFWTEGESFTRLVRDLWKSTDVKVAFDTLDVGGQTTIEVAVKILTGKMKFVGDTRTGDLHIEDSNEYEKESFDSPDDIIKQLETRWLEASYTLNMIKYNNYMDAKTRVVNGAKSENTQNIIETIKKLVDNLAVAYTIVGKSISDLPFDRGIVRLTEDDNRNILFSKCMKESLEHSSRSLKIVSGYSRGTAGENKKKKIRASRFINGSDGWLSPSGEFFRCLYGEHRRVADAIVPDGDDSTLELEKRCWVKLSDNYVYTNHITELSGPQKQKITDYMGRYDLNKIFIDSKTYKVEDLMS